MHVIESHVPDLAYYGIHAVEALFTRSWGRGVRIATELPATPTDTDVVSGPWSGGRTGVVYALRSARGFNVTVFGSKSIASGGQPTAYRELAQQMVRFFQTKQAPVSEKEMLEVIAFIQAADESKKNGGKPVSVGDLIPGGPEVLTDWPPLGSCGGQGSIIQTGESMEKRLLR